MILKCLFVQSRPVSGSGMSGEQYYYFILLSETAHRNIWSNNTEEQTHFKTQPQHISFRASNVFGFDKILVKCSPTQPLPLHQNTIRPSSLYVFVFACLFIIYKNVNSASTSKILCRWRNDYSKCIFVGKTDVEQCDMFILKDLIT